MTGSPPPTAFLRQVTAGLTPPYPLVGPTLLGRDPGCQIVLESQQHGGVSRSHAELRPSAQSPSGWQICDLNSANGTYVNGYRIKGCCNLQAGDRITLAQDGPQFVFEHSPLGESQLGSSPTRPTAVEPQGAPLGAAVQPSQPSPEAVTLSQLFPILSTGRDLTHKAYLIPGVITVTFVVLLFVSIGKPSFFNALLGAYIAGIAFFFVYQLCGKLKPWWVLVSSALLTMILLYSPVLSLLVWLFRGLLPGAIPKTPVSFPVMLVRMFFGAGLMEELLKALPVLLAYALGTRLRSPWRYAIGIWEPLDGILLGSASAVGFTLVETLGEYVPTVVNDFTIPAAQGELLGLQLLIARILGSIAGHMAYSGYLGYFIGLSVLKPTKRWRILGVGYLTAAALHALWNTMGQINPLVLALVGIISYAFLTAAILKARALSPTRSDNFATRFSNPLGRWP